MNTLKTTTNRELFLEKLVPYMDNGGRECVYDAYMFAKYAHRGTNRNGGGRYFEHPRAVAEIIIDELGIANDWRIIAVALLHDVLEDTWLLTPNLTKKIFGEDVANWLSFLTRKKNHSNEEFEKYIKNIEDCGIWQIILIKLCDRLHNLRTMETLEAVWCERYICQTEKYFYKLAKVLIRIAPEQMTEKAVALEKALILEINKVKKDISRTPTQKGE